MRPQKGELNHGAKLRLWQVKEIRASDEPAKTIAERFGISSETVYDIRRRATWNDGPRTEDICQRCGSPILNLVGIYGNRVVVDFAPRPGGIKKIGRAAARSREGDYREHECFSYRK